MHQVDDLGVIGTAGARVTMPLSGNRIAGMTKR